MAEVKVLVACHDPVLHGLITMNSYVYKGVSSPQFSYDFVDSRTSTPRGWMSNEEKRRIDKKYKQDDAKKAEEEIKIVNARKKEYARIFESIRSFPGYTDTQIYTSESWSDVPENTYDIVTTLYCPMFQRGGIDKQAFTKFLRNAYRVLKPSGVFLIQSTSLHDQAAETGFPQIPGFLRDIAYLEPKQVSTEFPEFWYTYVPEVTYDVVDDKVIRQIEHRNKNNSYIAGSRAVVRYRKQPPRDNLDQETLAAMRTGGRRKTYRMPRKYSRAYCRKTTCRNMGFTQRSSCRPYKNCFRFGRKGRFGTVST